MQVAAWPIVLMSYACPPQSISGAHGLPVCCPKQCGQCGGKGCELRPGGRDRCCALAILANGTHCTALKRPPCKPGRMAQYREQHEGLEHHMRQRDAPSDHMRGTCSVQSTSPSVRGSLERPEADCEWHDRGRFVLAVEQTASPASTVSACRARCSACKGCNFVSVGRATCSWHSTCTLNPNASADRTFIKLLDAKEAVVSEGKSDNPPPLTHSAYTRVCDMERTGLPVYVLAPQNSERVGTIARWLHAGDVHRTLRPCVDHILAPDGRAFDVQRMVDAGRLSPDFSSYFAGKLSGVVNASAPMAARGSGIPPSAAAPKYASLWRRDYLRKELGIAEGHLRIWSQFAAQASPHRPRRVALVLEPDIVLSEPTRFLSRLQYALEEVRKGTKGGNHSHGHHQSRGPEGLYLIGYWRVDGDSKPARASLAHSGRP